MIEPRSWKPDLEVSASWWLVIDAPERRPLAPWQVAILATIGAAPGLGLSVLPCLLLYAYKQSFVATGSPDSVFNAFTLAALDCVLLAAALLVAALVLLFFRTLRVVGVAYLCGLVCGTGFDLLLGLANSL
jgi:PhoPQ-activated pathogenicity-related protein